jgi:hypothetical protein
MEALLFTSPRRGPYGGEVKRGGINVIGICS